MPTSVTKADWENFRAKGAVPTRARTEIAQSWRRSATATDFQRKQAPKVGDGVLELAQRKARRFLMAARPAIEKAGYLLNRSGNMILLCDAEGVVLDIAGDPATLSQGQENHLAIGGRWREEDIGTNAIGVAISTGRPVQVIRVEHYCEEIQRWSCSATPVHDPATGRLVGVVDVSWPADLTRQDDNALSAMLGLQAETAFRQDLQLERERLHEMASIRRLRRGAAPMALLDRYGVEVLATDNFMRFCDDDSALGRLRETMPDLLDLPAEQIAQAVAEALPDLETEILQDRGRDIGLLLTRRPTRPAAAAAPFQALDEIARVGDTMAAICRQAAKLSQSMLPILIEGETGAGKSTLAAAIHQAGPTAAKPMERLDCSLIDAARLRADLADGLADRLAFEFGAICFESPAACPPEAQKLLLNLFERVADVGLRVISLSTRNLADEVAAGRFRSDLFYRLAVGRLRAPPLRERREEIAPHLRAIVRSKAAPGRSLIFSGAAISALTAYDWPGNLREMSNLVGLLMAVAPNGMIDYRTLPEEFRRPRRPEGETLRDGERGRILDTLDATGGNLTEAARKLGIARSTLYVKLESHGISRPQR